MSENLIPFQPSTPARPRAVVYAGPDDVVVDPDLTTADKRAILASWVSDGRAVDNAPTPRRLDSGGAVEVVRSSKRCDDSTGRFPSVATSQKTRCPPAKAASSFDCLRAAIVRTASTTTTRLRRRRAAGSPFVRSSAAPLAARGA
jgi:hypothetical protein